jgi:hypothetical protein
LDLCIFAIIINQSKFFMKKLMYLFVAAIMFAFTACGGGTATEEAATEEAATEEVATEEVATEEVATEEVAEEATEEATEEEAAE